jgi:hypothetical protein
MKMNSIFPSVIWMISISFIIQYYIMSYITVNNFSNIINSLGKIYMSSIMAIMMGLAEVFMFDIMNNSIHLIYYYILFLLLAILYLLYSMQFGINDDEYLKEMIQHHEMAIKSSIEIEDKTSNYKVKKFAKNIINGQEDEIKYMKKLLKENPN